MNFQLVNSLSIIILLAFSIRTLRNTIYFLFLWQNKEYRLDRMLIHLGTKQGQRLLFGPLSILKTVLLILFIFGSIQESQILTEVSIWSFSAILILEATKNVKDFFNRAVPFPKISLKIAVIFAITLIGQLIFIVISPPRFALDYLPFLDKLLGLSIAVQMAIFSVPAVMKNSFYKMLAREKIRKLDNLKVVGITGSYGKTSTKEYTAQLLKQKFEVVKTPANDNTAIGVAKAILKPVNNNTEYFVMEAGAYKKGEIKEIAGLVNNKLKMTLITGINSQHLDLFKSIDNIAKAKYELIDSLRKPGIAIFNANNKSARRLANKAKKSGYNTVLYGSDKRIFAHATNIKVTPQILEFTLHLGKNVAKVKTSIIGRHNIENILAAAVVADKAGVRFKDIAAGISNLKPAGATLNYSKKGKSVLINDSYNANPDGVSAALDYLSIYKYTKVIVLRPLIELGSNSENVHKKIGYKAGKICDAILLTNNNYNASIVEGIHSSGAKATIKVLPASQIKQFIEDNWSGKKAILFEGRESERVLNDYIS